MEVLSGGQSSPEELCGEGTGWGEAYFQESIKNATMSRDVFKNNRDAIANY